LSFKADVFLKRFGPHPQAVLSTFGLRCASADILSIFRHPHPLMIVFIAIQG
jgi:hypothetical protein